MSSMRDIARHELKKDQTVVIFFGGQPKLVRISAVAQDRLFFVNIDTGAEFNLRNKNIRKLYGRGDFRTIEQFDPADAMSAQFARKSSIAFSARDQKVQDEGYRSHWAMQELQKIQAKLGKGGDDAIALLHQAVKDKFGTIAGLSRSQVYKKLALWLASGCKIESVTPDFENRGNRDDKVEPDVKAATQRVIWTYFATKKKPGEDAAYQKLIKEIEDENEIRDPGRRLTIPSRAYLHRQIALCDQFLLTKAREGETVARQKYGHFGGGEIATRPLEIVEIDHTPIDIVAIDDDFRVVIGRVYLTIAIDRLTRCILGYSIDYEKPSYHSVAKCLAHAIAYKDEFLSRFGLSGEWPCFGLPQRILVDNGKEFHSKALEQACAALGIQIEYTPKRKSYLKGAVERSFRTINKDHFQNAQGTTFSNYLKRSEYDPEKDTLATESSIKKAMAIFVTEIYHLDGHTTLMKKPMDAWCESIAEFPPKMPPSVGDLNIALSKEFKQQKPVHHYGVEIDYLRYSGDGVGIIRNHHAHRPKKKYRVKVYPDDVTKISVLDNDGQWHDLKANDSDKLVGFSRAHWRTLRSFTAREFRKSINKIGIALAIARFHEVLTEQISRFDKRLSRELHKQLDLGKAIADRNNAEPDPLGELAEKMARPASKSESAPLDEDDDATDLEDDDDWEAEIDD